MFASPMLPARGSQRVTGMKTLILSATLAATALFAACEHGAPQPGPREIPSIGGQPTQVEPGTLEAPTGDPTTTEARPSSVPMRNHGGPIPVSPAVPTDAGTPLPTTAQPTPQGAVNPGPSAMIDTQRDLHSDDDLHLLPPAQRMPVTNIPAQPMPAGPMPTQTAPSSVKPDGGIFSDGGAPLPPIPDGGPLPQTRDASVPL